MDDDELRASWERMYADWGEIMQLVPNLVRVDVEGDLDATAPLLLVWPFV